MPKIKNSIKKSGIISDLPRLELRDKDHAIGSYPIKYTVENQEKFDDLNSIEFNDIENPNLNIQYPTMLPQNSKWSFGNAVVPNELSNIVTIGNVTKGVSDSHVRFITSEESNPFLDNNALDEDNEFYSTGTPENVLPGFSTRLSSKESFSIDINPNEDHEVYFSNGIVSTVYQDLTFENQSNSYTDIRVFYIDNNTSQPEAIVDGSAVFVYMNSGETTANQIRNAINNIGIDLFVRVTGNSNNPQTTIDNASQSLVAYVPKIETHSGLSYYNFKFGKWEDVGRSVNPNLFKNYIPSLSYNADNSSKVDYQNYNISYSTGSYLATIPSFWGVNVDKSDKILESDLNFIGNPTSFAGFPLSNKFDANKDQVINLKNYINGPFLLEKITIEVSGVLGTYPPYRSIYSDESAGESGIGTDFQLGTGTQFILMVQSDSNIQHLENKKFSYLEKNNGNWSVKKINSEFKVNNLKNIIFDCNITSYANGIENPNSLYPDLYTRTFENEEKFLQSNFGKAYDKAYPVKLNSNGIISAETYYNDVLNTSVLIPINENNFYTGSIKVEKSLSTNANSRYSNYALKLRNNPVGEGERKFFYDQDLNSLNLFDLSSGRSYIGNISDSIITEYDNNNLLNLNIPLYSTKSKNSPTIIYPKDNLIVTCVNQQLANVFDNSENIDSQKSLDKYLRTKLSPGLGKITFYGSYLNNGKSIDPESNQQLTSNAIHEDVKDSVSLDTNYRCLDQFHVEPEMSYSGSYVDTAKMSTYNFENTQFFNYFSMGQNHGFAISHTGKVYSFGTNTGRAMGVSNTSERFTTYSNPSNPDQNKLFNYDFVEATRLSNSNIKIADIVAGTNFSLVIDASGKLWSWGQNSNGSLGLGKLNGEKIQDPTKIEEFIYLNNQGTISTISSENIRVKKIVYHNNSILAILDETSELPHSDKVKFTNLAFWGQNNYGFDFLNPYNDSNSRPTLIPWYSEFRDSSENSCNYYYFKEAEFTDTSNNGITYGVDLDLDSGNSNHVFIDADLSSNHGLLLTKYDTSKPWNENLNNDVYSFGSNDKGQLGVKGWSYDDGSQYGTNYFTQIGYNNAFFKLFYQDLYPTPETATPIDSNKFVSQVQAGVSSSYALITSRKFFRISGRPQSSWPFYYRESDFKSWGQNDTTGNTIVDYKLGREVSTNNPNDLPRSVAFPNNDYPTSFYSSSNFILCLFSKYNKFNDKSPKNYDVIYGWGLNKEVPLETNLSLESSEIKKLSPFLIRKFDNFEESYQDTIKFFISSDIFGKAGSIYFKNKNLTTYYWGLPFTAERQYYNSSLLGFKEITYDPPQEFPRTFYYGSVLKEGNNKNSIQRFVRISSNESYYDSHVPLIKDIISKANSNVSSDQIGSNEIGNLTLYLPPTVPPEGREEIANWLFSFPFEPLFEGIERSRKVSYINSDDSSDNPTIIDSILLTGSVGLDYDKLYLETSRPGGPYPGSFITPISYLVEPGTLSKFFYGFGDYGGKFPLNLESIKDGNLSPIGLGRPRGDYYYIDETFDPEETINLRGFKYGLANVVPLYRTAVFRYDRFGQFRDMLEQGQDSKFFNSIENNNDSNRDNSDSPIYVRFLARENRAAADPNDTNNQNLSYFATSSLPYFDGVTRDRDTIQPDLESPIVVDVN